jgi:hypothetical protein
VRTEGVTREREISSADPIGCHFLSQPWSFHQTQWMSSEDQWWKKYTIKSIDTLIESYSSKSESHTVKYYLSKSIKVFGFKYT